MPGGRVRGDLELRVKRIDELPWLGVPGITILRAMVGNLVEHLVHIDLRGPRDAADLAAVTEKGVHGANPRSRYRAGSARRR